jgi:anti-anti-sigma factor
MKVDFKLDKEAKIKTFVIEGELDVHNVKNLKSDVSESLEDEEGWTFILDMGGVTYLDSSGLGMLVYIKKEITSQNGVLKLLNIQPQVLNVFKLTRLDEFFDLTAK